MQQTIKQLFLCLLILPTTTQPWGIPASTALISLYSRVSPLLTAVSKFEGDKKDPVSFFKDPSALIAGSTAACSIGISNKTMNTEYMRRLLERVPQARNARLQSAPGLILSTAVGVTAFQVLYLSAQNVRKRMTKSE